MMIYIRSLLITAVLVLPLAATAQRSAHLVKDIWPGSDPSAGSDPQGFVTVGSTTFFTAMTGQHRTVWKTDGTPAGTGPLVIAGKPTDGLDADQLTATSDLLFFRAFADATGAHTLWRTDGTTTGTVRLESNVDNLTRSGSIVFFTTDDAGHGNTLWKSDGSSEGTVQVAQINPRINGAVVFGFNDVGGTLFFFANADRTPTALWKSDGRATGAVLVKTVAPVTESSSLRTIAAVNAELFFTAYDDVLGQGLWKSNGTDEGTVLVKSISAVGRAFPASLTNADGQLFFVADDGLHGLELWRSDGTEAGTQLVRDINPGPSDSLPAFLTNLNGTLFFAADDGVHGTELWRSDGTEAGTVLIKDILPGANPSFPAELTDVAGTLFFRALDFLPDGDVAYPGTGELWKSDGTAAGTIRVKMIGTNFASNPSELADGNGALFFSANDGQTGREPWKSDGTADGTLLLKDINAPPASSNPHDLTVVGGGLYFTAADRVDPACALIQPCGDPWMSNGTAEGTQRRDDLLPGHVGWPSVPVLAGGTRFFSTNDGGTFAIWKTDETKDGTILLKSFPNSGLSYQLGLVPAGANVFFAAFEEETGYELWKSDGTPEGTTLVRDLIPGPLSGYPSNALAVDGILFFPGPGDEDGYFGVWKSDGTDQGTTLVKQIRVTPSSFPVSASAGGRQYFTVGKDLWVSDGTPEGTRVITAGALPDAFPSINSFPPDLFAVGDTLVYLTTTPEYGPELWRTDGTVEGTHILKDIYPGPGGSLPPPVRYFWHGGPYYPYYHAQVGTELFLVANDGVHGYTLWKSDGTSEGTQIVKERSPGALVHLTNVNGTLYFLADEGAYRTSLSLWKSDGTDRGTLRVDSLPWTLDIGFIGSTVFFPKDDPAIGRELWALDTSNIPPICEGDCDGDATVTVDELITGVNIALGNAPVGQCVAFDPDSSSEVTINDLIGAVNNALNGCG
jgi:ELWxxDGT repeat protein